MICFTLRMKKVSEFRFRWLLLFTAIIGVRFLLKGCITYFGVQMSSTGMHFNQNPVDEKPLHYNVVVFLSGCLVLPNLDDRNMLLI